MPPVLQTDVLVSNRYNAIPVDTLQVVCLYDGNGTCTFELECLDVNGTTAYVSIAGIAQFERSLILKRTDEGRKAARARGVAFGRPKKMRPDQAALARQLVLDGKSISAIARTFNVHPATIYRCIEPNSSL